MNRRLKTAFGEFLVKEISQAGMTQEKFYTSVGIKKPYFYDLLTASPPPIELQNRMIDILDDATGIDDDRRNKIHDLAAQVRGEIPADIYQLIRQHPEQWNDVRSALSQMIDDQQYALLNEDEESYGSTSENSVQHNL